MLGKVYTFYSYKGGVGRSMAMANIGALLAVWGKKVLLIDWDLEAPGLENYLREDNEHIIEEVRKKEGLIDLLIKRKNDPTYDANKIVWPGFISMIPIKTKDGHNKHSLDILTAGRRDDGYIRRVRELDYGSFYEESLGGEYLEGLREYWISHYDIVLIDSRTGLTDSSGVCTIQMPDALVMLFTATDQGFTGTLNIANRAIEAQKSIIYDRYSLKILPVPTRFDSTEFKLQRDWLTKFDQGLKEVYKTWVPDYPKDEKITIDQRKILELTKLPYVPYFSFGEKLPVIEQGTADPQGLGYALETVTAILAHDLEGAKLLVDNRDEYVNRAIHGISPYKDVLPDSIAIAPTTKTNKYLIQALIAAVAVVVAVVFFGVYNLKEKPQAIVDKNDSELDRLQYQLDLTTLQNHISTIDTMAIQNILDLNQEMYAKALSRDTSNIMINIRQTIRNAVQRELEFTLPLIYPEIQSYHKNKIQKLKHAEEGMDTPRSPIDKYFADTLLPFGPFSLLTKEALQNKLLEAPLKGYANKIEDYSIGIVQVDSFGFKITYNEIANYYFIGKDTTYRYSDQPLFIPVILQLNPNLKINGIYYESPKKILTQETADTYPKSLPKKFKPTNRPTKLPLHSKPNQKVEVKAKTSPSPPGISSPTPAHVVLPQIDSTIRKVEYMELKKEEVLSSKTAQTRVEIVSKDGLKSGALLNYQEKAILEELSGNKLYLPRVSGKSDYLDKKEVLSIRSSVILYSNSNKEEARQLQNLLARKLNIKIEMRPSYSLSENYLIIYLVDEQRNNINTEYNYSREQPTLLLKSKTTKENIPIKKN